MRATIQSGGDEDHYSKFARGAVRVPGEFVYPNWLFHVFQSLIDPIGISDESGRRHAKRGVLAQSRL